MEKARERGLREYTSIVGEGNVASRRMLEGLGDFVISERGERDKDKRWVKYKKKLE
ncbi:MAG: hypothetical protein ACTSWF_14880 [Candidatus Freyarchaeota archaeon]